VLLPYVYQTGLIGLAVVFWVGLYLLRLWRADGYGAVYPLILGVWLVGITITTSYGQLLPLTLALGWITVWPSLFCTTRTTDVTVASDAASTAPPQAVARPRRRAWGRTRAAAPAIGVAQPAAP
jgi:hypothetical protein